MVSWRIILSSKNNAKLRNNTKLKKIKIIPSWENNTKLKKIIVKKIMLSKK